MKKAKKTRSSQPRPTKTGTSVGKKPKEPGQAQDDIRVRARAARPSLDRALDSTLSPATGTELLMARGIFGHAPEFHRPRLVLFVGTPADGYAAVAALWFAALAAESKATVVLACADDAPPLASEMAMALAENGIDTRRVIPRTLTPELLAAGDLVVTLSSGRQARAKLPPTTRRREHWTISDPAQASARARAQADRKLAGAGKPASARTRATTLKRDALQDARALRDALRARVAMLVFSEGWGRPEISREDARVTRAKPVVRAFARPSARPLGGQPEGTAFSFIAEATPAWFASPSLSPLSLR